MLKPEQNRALMEVGPGTLMGELMRRYWMPFAAAGEMDKQATRPVRLLGEDLVLYKDLSGNYGLVDRHCPHRRADLSYGWVEECGLRCNYHGWKFDHTGACIHQPFEEVSHPDARFRERIKTKAYPVEAHAGLLWAYLGPSRTAGTELGAVHLEQRLRADRDDRDPVQLVSMPGKLHRSRCISSGCTTAGERAARADGWAGAADASQDPLRGVRLRV